MNNFWRLCRSPRCVGLIAAVLIAASAVGGWGDAACADDLYVDLTRLLPAPPPPGSTGERRDLQRVKILQQTASTARAALAIADDVEDVNQVFGGVLKVELTSANAPHLLALLRKADAVLGRATAQAKAFWHRPRPFVVDETIRCLVATRPANASYPSGHTIFAYDNALILAAMLPERRGALLARAAEYAQSRIIVGVHFPTDIQAGRLAGIALAHAFLCYEPAIDFAAARAELRTSLGYRADRPAERASDWRPSQCGLAEKG